MKLQLPWRQRRARVLFIIGCSILILFYQNCSNSGFKTQTQSIASSSSQSTPNPQPEPTPTPTPTPSPAPSSVPAAPSNLAIQILSETPPKVRLSCKDNSNNESNFNWFSGTTATTPWQDLVGIGQTAANTCSFDYSLDAKDKDYYVSVGAQNAAGFSEKTTPILVRINSSTPPPTPLPTGSVLDWNDSRVKWWVRADKSNLAIGQRFPNTSVQGTREKCNDSSTSGIDVVPEPNTNIDPATGQNRNVLSRSGGYFQHRVWEGQCLWGNQRPRSAINGSDQYSDTSSIKRGHGYWFAFGGKFHPDMFSQSNPNEEVRTTQILDFHHMGGGSQPQTSQSPWAMTVFGWGYETRFIWLKSDSGVSSPTGEVHWQEGYERVTMLTDRSKDTTNPHFFAFRFILDSRYDVPNKPFVEMYRQIGVDGPVVKIGRWDAPNFYNEPTNLVFPKYGLHYLFPDIEGAGTRSMDMVGAILVEDLSVPAETIFKSLTVAVPR